jgi:hypothetical protein
MIARHFNPLSMRRACRWTCVLLFLSKVLREDRITEPLGVDKFAELLQGQCTILDSESFR